MKNYENMSMDEIQRIVNKGGDDLLKLNDAVASHLDKLDLSDEVRDMVNQTDIRSLAEVFGGLFTAEQVAEFCKTFFV